MIQYDFKNAKQYKVTNTGLKAPSSNWSDIKCPWCETVSRAYWWSLSGSGKKCVNKKCGAMHFSSGITAQRVR